MFASFMPDMVGIHLPPHDAVDLTAEVGFDGFDLRLNRFVDDVERRGTSALRARMQELGLRPGYSSLVSGKVNVSEDEWAKHIADLPRRAAIAKELGYERTTSVVLPFSDEFEFAENFDLHVRRTQQACTILADYGIAFGLEYVSPMTRRRGQKHEFVYDLAGLLSLLDAVDEANAGIMIDCFHWACAEESVDDIRKLSPEQIIAVHVNDLVADRPLDEQTIMERELPGVTGLARVDAFLGALGEIGYEGPITAEPTHPQWSESDAESAARATAESVQSSIQAGRAWRTAHSDSR